MITLIISIVALWVASPALANNPVSGSDFTNNHGLSAALASAPMWFLASGSCGPSAAEDGQGHQTNGVKVPVVLCAINENQSGGCPQTPWIAPNTVYRDIPGEPFQPWVPTYYSVKFCTADSSWRVYYGLYFKHDSSHESDWEWAVVKWRTIGNNQWVRDSVLLEADGNYGGGAYTSIPNTFDGTNDWPTMGATNRDHPKFYISKHHHSVHWDPESRNKNSCDQPDFRANDYQFWAYWNLRHISTINPNWSYGKASNPWHIDPCDNSETVHKDPVSGFQ